MLSRVPKIERRGSIPGKSSCPSRRRRSKLQVRLESGTPRRSAATRLALPACEVPALQHVSLRPSHAARRLAASVRWLSVRRLGVHAHHRRARPAATRPPQASPPAPGDPAGDRRSMPPCGFRPLVEGCRRASARRPHSRGPSGRSSGTGDPQPPASARFAGLAGDGLGGNQRRAGPRGTVPRPQEVDRLRHFSVNVADD